jgi:naphthoate synthase/2-ketocyclohexanecarboxyl-CoA hydrolase
MANAAGKALPKFNDIILEVNGGVAKITINRPDVYNALRTETYGEIADAVLAADDDVTVGVIVLTGAGEKSFSSGGDVNAQAKRTVTLGRKHARECLRLSTALRNTSKPTIAAVNGYSIGAGHCLHLWCDITIASDKAKFGQVGPRVGSFPYWGPLQMLARLVGEKRAREMIYLCRQYTAEQALQMGLINAVVPHDQLMTETDKWCQEILDKSPLYLGMVKKGMNAASDMLYSTLTMGSEMLALTYGMDENMEGVHAFLEKRKPDFRKYRKAS